MEAFGIQSGRNRRHSAIDQKRTYFRHEPQDRAAIVLAVKVLLPEITALLWRLTMMPCDNTRPAVEPVKRILRIRTEPLFFHRLRTEHLFPEQHAETVVT